MRRSKPPRRSRIWSLRASVERLLADRSPAWAAAARERTGSSGRGDLPGALNQGEGGLIRCRPKSFVTKVWIDPGCIVCDACETTAPDVFEVLEETCIVRPAALSIEFTKPRTQAIKDAAEECPVDVIKFDVVALEVSEAEAAAVPAEAAARRLSRPRPRRPLRQPTPSRSPPRRSRLPRRRTT